MAGLEETLRGWRRSLGTNYFIVLLVQGEKVSWVQMRPVDSSEDEEQESNSFFDMAATNEGDDAPPLPPGGLKGRKGKAAERPSYVG